MKRYVKNILIYLAALLGIFAFVAMFAAALESYDSIKGTWSVYTIKAYLGEKYDDVVIYKGAILPIFGFVIPLLLSVFLIIESFQPSWSKSIKRINTVFAIIFFLCAILVLLTKEIFLKNNGLGDTLFIRNGGGPIFSAISSSLAGIILIFVTYFPSDKEINFIEK